LLSNVIFLIAVDIKKTCKHEKLYSSNYSRRAVQNVHRLLITGSRFLAKSSPATPTFVMPNEKRQVSCSANVKLSLKIRNMAPRTLFPKMIHACGGFSLAAATDQVNRQQDGHPVMQTVCTFQIKIFKPTYSINTTLQATFKLL
jgi:hypothetical protein